MKAVMYGAGNIGRGFIGALLAQSGYAVTFIDVNMQVVDTLHANHYYPVRIVDNDGHEDLTITGVDAINGNDLEAVADAIAAADIMASAVGVNILKFIVPNIVAGLRRRFAINSRPLNILICENLMDANHVLERMIKDLLTPDECLLFDQRVGLVETSIGRMVPVQTPDMQDGEPLRVCVERYGYLPVDQDAFKGAIPTIDRMIPFSPFGFYLKRKLYIHNMGHSICAYLGMISGKDYIFEAIDDPEILLIVKNAMLESIEGLAAEYDFPISDLLHHVDDLLTRFTNAALKDTCARVGQDPRRKLSPDDRLIGAIHLCLRHDILPAHIIVGATAALHHLLSDNGDKQTLEGAQKLLQEISGLAADDALTEEILKLYEILVAGASLSQLRRAAGAAKKASLTGII